MFEGHNLIEAIKSGDQNEFLSIFQKSDVDINHQYRDGETFLHMASEIKDGGDIVRTLLDNGADMKIAQNFFDYTPFHIAAINGNLESMKIMKEYGIEIDIQDGYGRTSKDILVQSLKHPKIVSWLCKNGSKSTANFETSPIEHSIFEPLDVMTDEDDDLLIIVDGHKLNLKMSLLTKYSPDLMNLLSEDGKVIHKCFSVDADLKTFGLVVEWLYTNEIETDDIDLITKAWNLSESLKIHELSRYLQNSKIIPILKNREEEGASLGDTILNFYDQSAKMEKGRYIRRFCASLILENIESVSEHEKFKDMDVNEFAEFIQSLYNDIDRYEKPDSGFKTIDTNEINFEGIKVIDSPHKRFLGYLPNPLSSKPVPAENVLLDLNPEKFEEMEICNIDVSWKTFFLFTKHGQMKFFRKFLIYGDQSQSTVNDYKRIQSVEISMPNKSITIRDIQNRSMYFTFKEIDGVQSIKSLLKDKVKIIEH